MSLRDILLSWEGTKYATSQCIKGGGVDCLRFVDAVLQEWRCEQLPPLPIWATDIAFHDVTACKKMIELMHTRYAPTQVVDVDNAKPGDVLIVGTKTAGGHHVAIVGPDTVDAWHSASRGVRKSSVRALQCGSFDIKEVIRAVR